MSEGLDSNPDAQRIGHIYANYLEVGQNAAEFVLALGTYNDGDAKPTISMHVHTSPVYARAFLNVLMSAVEHYERSVSQNI